MISQLVGEIRVSARVIQALALRFIIGRYGRENLGFLWVLIEPMLLCVGVMIMWRLMKGTTEHGVAVVAMVFSGYMPLTLWRHLTNSPIFIYRSTKGLRIHRQITYIDIVLSRLGLEFIATTSAVLIIYIFLTQTGLMAEAHDVSYMISGWLTAAALSFGAGMTIAAASEQSEVVAHFIQPFQYLTLPISGCFYMLDWLPSRYRELLEYVPLVHGYETFRHGLLGPSVQTYGDPQYALAWAVCLAAIGFIWLEMIKDRIE